MRLAVTPKPESARVSVLRESQVAARRILHEVWNFRTDSIHEVVRSGSVVEEVLACTTGTDNI